MKSVILIAGGSDTVEANEEVRGLATGLAAHLDGRYDRVACAFMAHAQPTVADAIAGEAGEGARELVCFPYFLTATPSWAQDLPAMVEQARRDHPDVTITLERYLGAQRAMPRLVAQLLP
jgi:sirohydrochlorin ferrochelatase